MALEAAYDVEAGDCYFQRLNYSGALQRYKTRPKKNREILPSMFELGRALEKLGQLPQAIEEYKAAQKLPGPRKWSEEAKSALALPQPVTGS